jgi:cytochrome P450
MEHPEIFSALPSMNETQQKALVDEVLRWATTTMHFRRTVVEDTELRGQLLKAGDKVVLWYVSANYDEDQFPDPDVFIADRTPNNHVAFGLQSPHLCLGAHLARLELRVMFEEMATAWSGIESAGPPERFRSNFISGTKNLPVRVTWR